VYLQKENDSVIATLLLNLFGDNPIVHSVLASLIICSVAIIIGRLSNKYRLFSRQNLYSAYFFVLLASFTSEIQVLSPALISLLFVTLFIRSCLNIYRYHLSGYEVFNIGVFASLAALIYPPFIILTVVALIAVLFFVGFNLKDVLKLIFGIISILIIAFSIFFFFELGDSNYLDHFGRSIYLFSSSYWNSDRIIYFAVIGLFSSLGIIGYYNFLKKKIIDARKKISFLYFILFFMFITPLFFVNTDIYYILGIAVITSFFIGLFLDGYRNNIGAEMIHLILLIALFSIQFNLLPV